MTEAHTTLLKDAQNFNIHPSTLAISLIDTASGADLCKSGVADVVPELIRMIARDTVQWELARSFQKRLTSSTLARAACRASES